MKKNKKAVLSIAGSDSSAGAGIQADLKTFNAMGLHGLTALTCVTAQNTQKVKKIQPLPAEIVGEQIEILTEDMNIAFAKSGMLFNEDIIKIVSEKIKQHNIKLVSDPVMFATSGDLLKNQKFTKSFKKHIIPKSYILTPNINEAQILTGFEIKKLEDIKHSCKNLHKMGAKNVLIKGGHLQGEQCIDVFYDGEQFETISLPRIRNKKAHGSGCTLSSLIAGFLTLNNSPHLSFKKSKYTLWNMINKGYKPAKGSDVLNQTSQIINEIPKEFKSEQYFNVWYELDKNIEKLLSFLPNELIAEVGMNFGYATPNAEKRAEICALAGRIVKGMHRPVKCGTLRFGGSKHVASIILAAINHDKNIRSVINLKYSWKIVDTCKKNNLKIGFFNRAEEPKTVESTMEWGTKEVIQKHGFVPDIIYDIGSVGKEPMIRLLGKNPDNVIKKLRILVKK